jgi:hypothetical protein
MDTANTTNNNRVDAPIVVYIVHHPDCGEAKRLAAGLFRWFRLGDFAGDAAAAGLPVYYRRTLKGNSMQPEISWDEAELNVVIVLVDHRMVSDHSWRAAIIKLTKDVTDQRDNEKQNRSLLLPVALHESFYQIGPLYQEFNPVRLLDLNEKQMEAVLRRAATEVITRGLQPAEKGGEPPPLNVFLSHAKRDGIRIAEQLRDGIRSFGQLVAWYDANDLPFGAPWQSPMEQAVEEDTAAMIATVTDAYPTRPWCRREAELARTPRCVRNSSEADTPSRVWTLQPVVAVHEPRTAWVHSLPMLAGVPRIGWDENNPVSTTASVVDRLVLEMLLAYTHRRVALRLNKALSHQPDMCFITWVPDTWTLVALKEKLKEKRISVQQIIFPGYGLPTMELTELKPALSIFGADVELKSFEEVWP